MIDEKITILDHGYIKLVESWGSDERIVESARMSTAKSFLGWGPKCRACGDSFDGPERDCPNTIIGGRPYIDCGRGGHVFDAPGDEKLLKFLWDNAHQTPFEMAGLTIEVKAPIFTLREWMRHRVPFGYNEMSARYIPLPDENYVPHPADVELRSEAAAHSRNNQARGATPRIVHGSEVAQWLHSLKKSYEMAQTVYEEGLRIGIPKELARLPVPVARYSVMRATANLRGWLGFIKLRSAPNAQYEIRVYSNVVADLIKQKFPRTYEVAKTSLGLQ